MPRLTKHKREKFKGEKALPQQAFSTKPYQMPRDLKAAAARAASHPELISVSSRVPLNPLEQ